ncbi:MAG: indole-3-glycerol phosphate synthase TrpC [Gammaproteobacteria bacterium]|nr:indole-3-glycerol phosphate synthase TrpC [Gammaproteobacteria bacterium]
MSAGVDILDKILAHKVDEVARRAQQTPLTTLRERLLDTPPPRGFVDAIRARIQSGQAGVIAEIKKASPSKGLIRDDFDPKALARSYADGGAACLSVLTDERFFQGADEFLDQARSACSLPVLRKEFITDSYQLYESRVLGADCVLLIVAALDDASLQLLYRTAQDIGMDVLVEIHEASELNRALRLEPALLGINNRNLRNFDTHLSTTLDLLPKVPKQCTVVTESGIATRDDVKLMRDNGVDCFLVGETFMRAPDPGQKLTELFADDPPLSDRTHA